MLLSTICVIVAPDDARLITEGSDERRRYMDALLCQIDPLYLQHFDRVLLLENGKVAKDLRGHDEIVSYRERIAMTLAGDL